MKSKYFTEEYWEGYLKDIGFKRYDHDGYGYVYLANDFLVVMVFICKMMSLKRGESSTDRAVFYFKERDLTLITIKHYDVIINMEEIKLVLDIVVHPDRAPLLAGISWADKIMAYLLGKVYEKADR